MHSVIRQGHSVRSDTQFSILGNNSYLLQILNLNPVGSGFETESNLFDMKICISSLITYCSYPLENLKTSFKFFRSPLIFI
jgi:hypothetical protein